MSAAAHAWECAFARLRPCQAEGVSLRQRKGKGKTKSAMPLQLVEWGCNSHTKKG